MNENILFFLIVFLIAIVVLAILIFIIISVFRLIKNLIKKIFQKDDDLRYVENIEVAVPELEESKEERQKIAEKQQKFGKTSMAGSKLQYYNNPASPENEKRTEEDQKQAFDEKEEKDIEEGLSALKKSGKKNDDEGETFFSKIKIPRAKRVVGGDAIKSARTGAEEQANLERIEKPDAGREKLTDNKSEILRGAEITIPKTAEAGQAYENKAPDLGREKVFSEVNKIGKTEPKIAGDNSIFGGKSEVSRIELRQKLRRDPKVWMAERQAGLNLNPIERAKLEKEVFSQALGRNISKTDLKWGIKKLNQKMFGTKNLAEKGKIRKEIKFFKKIGGIK
ncbi:MAG: hypothetical protein AAB925_02460 [Patescibacteria group bacterium]